MKIIEFLGIVGVVTLAVFIVSKPAKKMRDYQIELDKNIVYLYDGDRLLGSYTGKDTTGYLDSLLVKDNE